MSESSPVETANLSSLFADATAGLCGIRLAFLDKQEASNAADRMPLSYVLRGPKDSIHLVYLLSADEADAAQALVAELQKGDSDTAYAEFDVLGPDADYTLHEDDADHLACGGTFEAFAVAELEAAFFGREGDEKGLSAEEPESEESLRARLIDKLQNGNLTPAQDTALRFAGRGFYPIPVNGIVKNKKANKLECSCQKGKRFHAEKNNFKQVEECGSPGKHPTIMGWQDRNTRDPDVLMRFFAPEYNQRRTSVHDGLNIGLVTGPDTGLVVLDIDGTEGLASVAALEEQYGPLPETIAVTTGSGGRHCYFLAPTGETILNSASKIAPKVDFRGEHGFVVAPPSKHISGGSYRWAEGNSPDDLPLAEMPEWLIKLALEGGEKEAGGKPGKRVAKPSGKKQRADSRKATSGSGRVEGGWRGYLTYVGDHEGGRAFDAPIWDAMLSFLRENGHDADEAEFMEALAETVALADKSKGDNRDRYLPDSEHIADKLDKARQTIRDTPDVPLSVNESGELEFGKSSPFRRTTRHGRPWFGYWKSDDDGGGNIVPSCQAFRVASVASDTAGGGASITIEFDTAHNGTQEVTFSRASLFDRQEVPKLLAGKWFEFEDASGTLDLLKALILPIDTLNVDRTGWHICSFLHPCGTTIHGPSNDGTGKKLRLGNGAIAGAWRGGELEGWKAAAAPAFHNEARGREQFALGVMAGCAGIVAGFVGITGFPILNLHGNTSRGKSTALMLAASSSGAPNERGAYQSLRKTDNGMESILSARSGITVAFDEGKTTTADILDNIVWMMAHGAGKTRGTVTGDARAGKEFCGFAMTANEIPLAQMLAQGRKSQPGGFHARVCDVDVSSVPELVGAYKDRFFAAVAGVKVHYGHTWEPVVRHLQELGREHVVSALDRLTKELAGPDADAFTERSARTLALVWYSGMVMQELALIPACNLARVAKWAWGTRAVESTLDPFTRAMETLMTNVALRRGIDIYEWDEPQSVTVTTNDDGSKETIVQKRQRYREAAGFIHMSGLEELLLVPRDKLADLCGGHMSGGMIRDQMAAHDLLALSGKKDPKPRWSNLPDGQALSHYRIKLVQLADLVSA